MTARQGLRRHRRDHDRCTHAVTFAVPARIFGARVLQYRHLDLHVQLLADFLAHAVQGLAAARAALPVLGQVVLDALARQIRRQRFAASLARFGLVELWQPGVRQRGHVAVVLAGRLRCGFFFGLVEHAVPPLLALRRILPGQRETILLFQRIEALGQILASRSAMSCTSVVTRSSSSWV